MMCPVHPLTILEILHNPTIECLSPRNALTVGNNGQETIHLKVFLHEIMYLICVTTIGYPPNMQLADQRSICAFPIRPSLDN